MPGKIKSTAQFRLFEAAAGGKATNGPSQSVAKKMLGEESHETKSRLAKGGNFARALKRSKKSKSGY